jgi:hypothetical protein
MLRFPEKKTTGWYFGSLEAHTDPLGYAEYWGNMALCEAEQRFLLLFLEKEECHQPSLPQKAILYNKLPGLFPGRKDNDPTSAKPTLGIWGVPQ